MEKSSKEFNFLLNICHNAIFKGNSYNQVSINLPENLNWAELLKLATRHRVRPLLFIGLKKYNYQEKLPANFMEQMKVINFQITTNNLIHSRELIRLFKLFDNQGINVIPYKGIILANEAYNNVGAREFSDIDLLIDQKDIKAVKNILLGQDYEWKTFISDKLAARYYSKSYEHSFHYYQNDQRQYAIDLHWRLGTKQFQLAIDFNMLRSLIHPERRYHLAIPLLNPEGLLLTTCLHHFGKDDSYKLKNIGDIAALLNRYEHSINWQLLLTTAQQWKIKNIVLLGIGVAGTLFSIKLPEATQSAIQSKKIKKHIDQHIQILERDNHNDNIVSKDFTSSVLFHLSLREHLSTKLKIIFHFFLFLILPTAKDLEENPTANYWYILLRKPFRLSSKYVFPTKEK